LQLVYIGLARELQAKGSELATEINIASNQWWPCVCGLNGDKPDYLVERSKIVFEIVASEASFYSGGLPYSTVYTRLHVLNFEEFVLMYVKPLAVLLFSVLLLSCASMGGGSVTEKRTAILEMQEAALNQLYEKRPDTRSQLQAALGYAVFSNANINLLFVSAGTGYGVVWDKKQAKNTYMNMAEGGVGLGLGVKDYRIVIVFHTTVAINRFIESGWTFGGNADAAAKASDKGVSAEGEVYYGDVTVYTFTKSGLALQATIKGTKFWGDDELN
jgi:lipid-binding SYLF domain-containing protein